MTPWEFWRSDFNNLVTSMINKDDEICREVMQSVGLTPECIKKVLLTGGTTNIPAVVSSIPKLFNRAAHLALDPQETGAVGAAIYGGLLSGQLNSAKILPVELGMLVNDQYSCLLAADSPFPCQVTKPLNQTTAGSLIVCRGENQHELMPIDLQSLNAHMSEVTLRVDAAGTIVVMLKYSNGDLTWHYLDDLLLILEQSRQDRAA